MAGRAKVAVAGHGAALAFACLCVGAPAAEPDAAQAHLRFDWFRVEVAVFQRRADAPLGQARSRLRDAFRLPRLAAPLLERAPPATGLALGRHGPLAYTLPVLASNLPPPRWLGPCTQARWRPGPGAPAPDPCLWQRPPPVDLEAYFPDDVLRGWRVPQLPPDELTLPTPDGEPAPGAHRAELLAQVQEDFAAYEADLLESSYEWRRETAALAPTLPVLRRRFDVLAAGSWHQPVPPREQPFPLLVQLGDADAAAPPLLEGSFTVTKGRYLHFDAHLLLRLGAGEAALLAQKRRMRPDELHYLDHPAFGLLLHATPLNVPDELRTLVEDLDAPSATLDADATAAGGFDG